MTALVKLPQKFLSDHEERDLDTPEIVKKSKTHFWVRQDDPALPELESDADHYANGGISTSDFPELFGLVASARATFSAIQKAKK